MKSLNILNPKYININTYPIDNIFNDVIKDRRRGEYLKKYIVIHTK